MSAGTISKGDRVKVMTGASGGRVGTVAHVAHSWSTGRPIVHVELVVPVLIAEPDGPTCVVVLTYDVDELERVAS